MQVLENPIIHVSDLHYNDNLTCYYTGGIALAILKHCQPEHLSLGLQMEALKTLKMAQLISIGKVRSPLPCFHCLTYADIEQTSPLAKYTHPLLIYLFKSTSYHAFISAYPQSTELLHEIYDKERQTLSAVSPRCSSLARLTHPLIGEKLPM